MSFNKEMFRLKGWEWKAMQIKKPSVVDKYTKDLVYYRLIPILREEPEKFNPKTEKGYRKRKHHQFLTDDVGHPKLAEHLFAILGLMKASKNWNQFYRMVKRAFPKFEGNRMLPFYNAN